VHGGGAAWRLHPAAGGGGGSVRAGGRSMGRSVGTRTSQLPGRASC
jgi:hypothetical protein